MINYIKTQNSFCSIVIRLYNKKLCSVSLIICRDVITKRHYMAHAKKKSASDAVTEGGSVICKKLPCDRDDSILLRYIKNLPAARESNPHLFLI